MKFHNTDLIKKILILGLTIGLIGTIFYSIYNTTINKNTEVKNGFTENHNIELNSLSKGDE